MIHNYTSASLKHLLQHEIARDSVMLSIMRGTPTTTGFQIRRAVERILDHDLDSLPGVADVRSLLRFMLILRGGLR